MRLFLPEVSRDLRPLRRCLALIATSAATMPGTWHAMAWVVMWAAVAMTWLGFLGGMAWMVFGDCGRGSR